MKEKDELQNGGKIEIRHKVTTIPLGDAGGEVEHANLPEILPILTLRSSVLFPGSITPITVGREKSVTLVRDVYENHGYLGAVLQKDIDIENPTPDDMYKIGTAAKILKILEMPNGSLTVILNGLDKINVEEYVQVNPYYKAKVTVIPDSDGDTKSVESDALLESIKDYAIKIIRSSNNIPKEAEFAIKNLDTKRAIVNFICGNLELEDADMQKLLEEPGLMARARKLLEILVQEQEKLNLRDEIQTKVKHELDRQQRNYFLQQQLRTIQEELDELNGTNSSEDEVSETNEDGEFTSANDYQKFKKLAAKKNWSEAAKRHFTREVEKFKKMNPMIAEYTVYLNYLQFMLDLPWNTMTKDVIDLKKAKDQLDKDHFGLDKVKDRILEHLSVLKLKGDLKSPILCLYGPPGVGKTSLGKSVAEALGRKFGRISLGGIHDESEIRGHRRTYIGAMAGRILETIKRCGSSNPVIILDEIDKISISNHGDPSSALLEVLDPEQNSTFHDNYLDLEYDLSNVLFIATANDVGNIPSALRDRMEMIEIPGYILEDKIQIAKKHLVKKEIEAHGLKRENFRIDDNVISKIIADYTRESGVRTLDKLIAKLCRARAKDKVMSPSDALTHINQEYVLKVLGKPKFINDEYEIKDMVGVVTGLAWTAVGGDILYIESILTPGKGKLSLTGNLGDVMKESATIALEWVKAHYEELGIDKTKFEEYDLNIHVPEGAIPKDGPSAGITMITSIVSTYTGRKVKERIAMTGETTLRGRVTPIGGVREKILAAKRAGIKTILLPEINKRDLDEINQNYIEGLKFHFVKTNKEVLDLALV